MQCVCVTSLALILYMYHQRFNEIHVVADIFAVSKTVVSYYCFFFHSSQGFFVVARNIYQCNLAYRFEIFQVGKMNSLNWRLVLFLNCMRQLEFFVYKWQNIWMQIITNDNWTDWHSFASFIAFSLSLFFRLCLFLPPSKDLQCLLQSKISVRNICWASPIFSRSLKFQCPGQILNRSVDVCGIFMSI